MIILRVDFSSQIGLGHFKRLMVLMENEKWKMENVIIVCKECIESLSPYPIIKIKNENEFFEKVKTLKPKEVIVDNYNFTYEDEKNFKTLFPDIKLICFDDLYMPHYCDEIINHNLYAKKEKYKNLPTFTKVKIIKPLIRKEFKLAKKRHFQKEGIFLSLGGSDAKNLTLKILKILKPLRIKVNLYTTSANKNLEKLKKFTFLNRRVKLHIDEDVAIGMAKSEFGIITPSVISYEAIYMNLPFIAIKVADNQKYITKFLKEKRYIVLNEKEIIKVKELLWKLL
ncbi:UDP-2,4-diacetamido-2,4,6-trideoxy-beta-L-altropyranose hydrolase [Caminibacter mediatlanticus]|uniref:Possible flagellar protein n=1 Tax=Caminibacter mediatlanticus TB-2 TaxID=391592 RepID=A0AAI9AH68_9BACT|nr:UDP-2,4-diacetamido-2,4,6-trideoxy-beta-L-altropyranose hydrolase [Caminibacter mediatlanticus]EDM23562.1 possible flagellar protein [Caminibacter mediatlanticus TB-2]